MLRDLIASLRSGGPKRTARIVAVVAAACVGATAMAMSVQAQTEAKPAVPAEAPAPASPQPWTITCNGQGPAGALVCAMSQGLIAKNSGQRVLSVTISKNPSGGYVAGFSLPHGLLLSEGVQVWVDDGARTKHTITTADQNGSYAPMPLEAAMLATMKKGTILNVLVKAVSGDEVIFQLSLNGFTAALDKI